VPTGQQIAWSPVRQTRSAAQQRPFTQTAPVGQQTAAPVLVRAHGARPSGQTHRPARQSVPSGQQIRSFPDEHTRSFGQQRSRRQAASGGQQIVPQTSWLVLVQTQTCRPFCSWHWASPGQQTSPQGSCPVVSQTQTRRSSRSSQCVPGGQQTSPQKLRLSGQTQRPSRQTVPGGQQNCWLLAEQARSPGQHCWPMQTASGGQQIVAQSGQLSSQTHLPSTQWEPSGQQNLSPLGEAQARLPGQQRPPRQTAPGGQQTRSPPGGAQKSRPSGQTQTPFRQTEPPGQQKVPCAFEQAASRRQHCPLRQTLPSGQQNGSCSRRQKRVRSAAQRIQIPPPLAASRRH
jgi:hypothetical protein